MIKAILDLLRSDGYITVNKTLAYNIGLVPATIFSELSAKYNYFSIRDELRDGYFYCTIPDLQKNTGLKKDEQDTAINKLIKFGLIEKKVKKLKGDEAPKRYFKIVEDVNILMKYLDNSGFEENPKSKTENLKNDIVDPSPNKNNKTITITKENKLVSLLGVDEEDNTIVPTEEEKLTNELTVIFKQAQIELYDDIAFKQVLEDVVKDALTSPETSHIIKKLKLEHIDKAVYKYREALENKTIKNPKLYFSKCLISAIREEGLNGLFSG